MTKLPAPWEQNPQENKGKEAPKSRAKPKPKKAGAPAELYKQPDGKHSFQPGNKLWQLWDRTKPFAHRTYQSAQDLFEKIYEYFEWVETNPLEEEVHHFSKDGGFETGRVNKMRAMTIKGCCIFLGVDNQCWYQWKKEQPDLLPVILWAEDVIFTYKLEGAAAGLLNYQIISRELGLAEKHEHSGPGGAPMQTITKEMTAAEAAEIYQETLQAGRNEQ